MTVSVKFFRIGVWIVLLSAILATGCAFRGGRKDPVPVSEERVRLIAGMFFDRYRGEESGGIVVTSPCDGAVFPLEIAAPVFEWKDAAPDARYWLVAAETEGGNPVYRITRKKHWQPDGGQWEKIRKHSLNSPAVITIFGFETIDSEEAVSSGRIRIKASDDPVDALIIYRQVPLPFMAGEKNFRKIKWRLGDIRSYDPPRVVMQDLPVCASCHQVTGDGKTISMEMNYRNDSGAHFIAPVRETVSLTESDFMTWSDFPRLPVVPKTRGLFARMSPSGRHLVGTVNDVSYAALTNDPEFCQLFFPTNGILACYSVEKKTFRPLSGADDAAYVQTNPEWRPDEKQIVFARTETRNEYHENIAAIKTRVEDCGIDELNRRFPIRFDLWTVPFNNGNGGRPQPLKGASGNGMSNYFPRFSPDGKWIVFTRSRTGIMLQPDSELYIMPSAGGVARRMTCNRNRFNSWHSWSPGGRWLIFSSKANSVYTEIFMTHIDENGNDSPPVRLSRFSDSDMAANLPEFVSRNAGRIERIRLGP